MTIGGSIALIIIGMILAFAVTWTPAGIDINTVGVILIWGGVLCLFFSILFLVMKRHRERERSAALAEQRRYAGSPPPPDPYRPPPDPYRPPPDPYRPPPDPYQP